MDQLPSPQLLAFYDAFANELDRNVGPLQPLPDWLPYQRDRVAMGQFMLRAGTVCVHQRSKLSPTDSFSAGGTTMSVLSDRDSVLAGCPRPQRVQLTGLQFAEGVYGCHVAEVDTESAREAARKFCQVAAWLAVCCLGLKGGQACVHLLNVEDLSAAGKSEKWVAYAKILVMPRWKEDL